MGARGPEMLGFSARGHFAAVAGREPVLDARRCTVQLSNGRLYLDAAATTETALLGHDHPERSGQAGMALREFLERLDTDYVALAVRREIGAAVRLACRLATRLRRGSRLEIVNAGTGEPNSNDRITIAIENETLGRTGVWFASAHWRRRPEFVVVGPALAAGGAFAALLVSRSSVGALGEIEHGADPAARRDVEVAERVAAAIEHFAAHRLLEHGLQLASYLERRLQVACSLYPEAVSLQSDAWGARILLSGNLTAAKLQRRLCERGVLVGVFNENVVAIQPPLPMRLAEVDVICGALRAALADGPGPGVLVCCPSCEDAMNGFACSEP